jgi:hypothetical protein
MAKGKIGAVINENRELQRFTYQGEDFHSDCSITSDGSRSVDISYYDITEPINRDELKKLVYIYYGDEDRVTYNVAILNFDSSFIKIQISNENRVEIIELTKNSSGGVESIYRGDYSGSFSGDGSGTWNFTIDKKGKISGYANSYSLGRVNLHGQLSNSNMTVGGASKDGVNVSFKGTINQETGSVSGSWNTSNGYSGTFRGDRE